MELRKSRRKRNKGKNNFLTKNWREQIENREMGSKGRKPPLQITKVVSLVNIVGCLGMKERNCWKKQGKYFNCGEMEHKVQECPKKPRERGGSQGDFFPIGKERGQVTNQRCLP